MKLVLTAAALAAPVRQTAAPVSGGDRDGVSFAGVRQTDLASKVQAPPPFDSARIALIRGAVDNGSYNADPAAIARAMIAFPELVSGAPE